jgi:hypothetical protein
MVILLLKRHIYSRDGSLNLSTSSLFKDLTNLIAEDTRILVLLGQVWGTRRTFQFISSISVIKLVHVALAPFFFDLYYVSTASKPERQMYTHRRKPIK